MKIREFTKAMKKFKFRAIETCMIKLFLLGMVVMIGFRSMTDDRMAFYILAVAYSLGMVIFISVLSIRRQWKNLRRFIADPSILYINDPEYPDLADAWNSSVDKYFKNKNIERGAEK